MSDLPARSMPWAQGKTATAPLSGKGNFEGDSHPVCVQRKRTKGWRMPERTIYVGRGSVWGNPFVVGSQSGIFDGEDGRPLGLRDKPEILVPEMTLECSLRFYRDLFHGFLYPEMFPFGHDWMARFKAKHHGHPGEAVRRLRGWNVACFCKLDEPCHGDVLLEIANAR